MGLAVAIISIFLTQLHYCSVDGNTNSEPKITCVSQFDYDYKTLTKVVETEHAQRELKQSVAYQAQTIQELTEKLNRLENVHSANVAFTAVIAHVGLTDLGPGDTLVFDKVINNIGSGYNDKTGIFEAPAGGVYVFNMDIMIRAGQRQYTQFAVNGRSVMPNYGDARGAKHYITSSRMLTISLSAGDRVCIQTADSPSHGNGIVHGNGFSTFSGWLQSPII